MDGEVELNELVPDPFQLRVSYDSNVVVNLAGSILQNGILSPLLVRRRNGKYEILDGNYRFQALKQIRWEKKIPVRIIEADDKDAIFIAAVSNWHRRSFKFTDKANTVKKMLELGLTEEMIAARLEISLRHLRERYIAYFKNVSDDAKELLSKTDLSQRHVEALMLLKEKPEQQKNLATEIVIRKLDGAEAKREAKKILTPEQKPSTWKCDCCLQEKPDSAEKKRIQICPDCYAKIIQAQKA
ncbi:MAG: ParB/RepB/Spo0J family partition protein [Candidatus Bathyarchaeota archaeon]|nr:ParB/RepB/Spo0J family partition protein [Candidatus Bathyarchaeota archaeon]